jgi:hypothetical protein
MTTITSNFDFVWTGIPAQLATVFVIRDRDNLTPARWVCALLHNTVCHGDPFCDAGWASYLSKLFTRGPYDFDLVHDLPTSGKRLRCPESDFVLFFAPDAAGVPASAGTGRCAKLIAVSASTRSTCRRSIRPS